MFYDDHNSPSHRGNSYEIIDLGFHDLLLAWGHGSHHGQLSHGNSNNKSNYFLIKQFSNHLVGLENVAWHIPIWLLQELSAPPQVTHTWLKIFSEIG